MVYCMRSISVNLKETPREAITCIMIYIFRNLALLRLLSRWQIIMEILFVLWVFLKDFTERNGNLLNLLWVFFSEVTPKLPAFLSKSIHSESGTTPFLLTIFRKNHNIQEPIAISLFGHLILLILFKQIYSSSIFQDKSITNTFEKPSLESPHWHLRHLLMDGYKQLVNFDKNHFEKKNSRVKNHLESISIKYRPQPI